jgi:CRP/FNR family transcriptional regulator, cyclic AMP receptor protein
VVATSGRADSPRRQLTQRPEPADKGTLARLLLHGQRWQQSGDTGSGWELVRALGSVDKEMRERASALLARVQDFRMPSGAQVALQIRSERGSSSATKPGCPGRFGEKEMNTPYGLEIIESCNGCKLRKEHSFCNLSPGLLKLFNAASHSSTYPGNAILFVEGQMPRGAFVLCSGRVKLSTTSRDGKVLILKIADAGDILGLSAVISGTEYEVTAETSMPCHVNFVEREALIDLIAKNGEMGLRSAEALSREFQSAYRDIHDLVLARSSAGKLARLLLSWTDGQKTEREIRIRSSLTHEEMAQMIGSSRETVTRLLSDLKKKEFIRLEGSILVIRNKTALEALAV